MKDIIQRILPLVQKPARYTGGEFNQIVKSLCIRCKQLANMIE